MIYCRTPVYRLFYSLRSGHKMSRVKLAARLGISEDHLYNIETGRRFPSIKVTIALARLFEANPEWIKYHWLESYLSWVEVKVKKKLGL